MIFRKSLLLLALIPLVGAVSEKTENEEDENRDSLAESRPIPPIRVYLHNVLSNLKRLEARIQRLEAFKLTQLRGRDGRDGIQGKPGKDGRDGQAGARGPRGPRGFRGARGRNGARGPRGPRNGGVQYIRWGKTSCPRGSSLVYKGRIGGEHYAHRGGGTNYMCLTEHPRYIHSRPGFQNGGRMYGTEYEVRDNQQLFTRQNLHDHDAPCAVCFVSSRTAKLMIPGTYICPAGWRREYWGNLMTEHYAHPHARDFICVDRGAEAVIGSHRNINGALLYPVQGVCGSLPCGPYKQGLELTCAVCTK